MIEIQRQQAASQVYENFLPATACVSTLNAPGTRGPSTFTVARGHRVKDASAYLTYASASSTSAMTNTKNDKQFAQQIQPGVSKIKNENCLGPITIPSNGVMPATAVNQLREINDTILLSTLISTTDPNYRREDIIAAARQSIGPAVCVTCGRVSWQEGKVNFASGCAGCKGVNAGDTNADGTLKWKSAIAYQRTVT
jgi:predicted Zn-ribbon and HTH transcriptional regulator